MRPSRPSAEFQLEDLYSDSGELYAYLGSNSWNRTDPRGTFFGGYLGVLITAFMMPIDIYGTLQDVEQHLTMKQNARQVFDMMSVNMMMDVDWALDMSMPDNASTRSGISDEATTPVISGGGSVSEPEQAIAGNVSPARPIINRFHSRIGGISTEHDRLLKMAYRYYIARFGADNVRFNQALAKNVGSHFEISAPIRPDLQVYDSARGKYIIVELGDTNRLAAGGAGMRRRTIANHLGVSVADVEMINLNRGAKAMIRGRPPIPRRLKAW